MTPIVLLAGGEVLCLLSFICLLLSVLLKVFSRNITFFGKNLQKKLSSQKTVLGSFFKISALQKLLSSFLAKTLIFWLEVTLELTVYNRVGVIINIDI